MYHFCQSFGQLVCEVVSQSTSGRPVCQCISMPAKQPGS